MREDISEMAAKRAPEGKIDRGFLARHENRRKCFGRLYARVSTNDQQTIPCRSCSAGVRRPARLDDSDASERGR